MCDLDIHRKNDDDDSYVLINEFQQKGIYGVSFDRQQCAMYSPFLEWPEFCMPTCERYSSSRQTCAQDRDRFEDLTIVVKPGTMHDMPMRPSFNSAMQIISSPSLELHPGMEATFI